MDKVGGDINPSKCAHTKNKQLWHVVFIEMNNMPLSKSCVCLSEAPDNSTNITTCNIPNSLDVYFVYKKYEGSDIEGTGSCAISFCKDGNTKLNATNCQTRGKRIATVCDNSTTPKAINRTYAESMSLCFKRNRLLLQPGTFCNHINNSNGLFAWSTVFRAEMSAKLTKEEAGNFKPVRCLSGIVDASNSYKTLNITTRNCSTKLKWVVCRKSPIVGGILAIIISSVIAILIVRKRRKNDPFGKMDDTKPTECSNEKEGITLHAYVGYNECKDYKRNSFEMEVIKSEYEGVDEKEKKHTSYCDIGNAYIESSVGEYDTTNNLNKRKQSVHGNLYDTTSGIRNTIDPTYNTLERLPKVDNDEFYVHSFPRGRSESDYHISDSRKSGKNGEIIVYDKA
ncbi:unnamed protein product [Mytilus coruscus]|uniref:Uncharacterized protein n=1 Tax=Mytilus coruscus TaxID=42192 RepID=A0A6J8EVR0_MYTCO|nr:unnamed protein product [Mytilus coruscus]